MRHNSLVPWLVALVVFGPFGLAMLIYYSPWGRDWLPQLPGQRELLATPVMLPPDWRAGGSGESSWLLIYAKMGPCEQQCAQDLDRVSRVRLALNRDQDRFRLALWYAGDAAAVSGDGQLDLRRLDTEPGRSIAAALGPERLGAGRVLIADPRGSVILSYPADIEQKELLRDLKRLLGASGTG